MSDEKGATAQKGADLHVHYCEHPDCKKWGSFGYAIGKAPPNWFCVEHRLEWTPRHA